MSQKKGTVSKSPYFQQKSTEDSLEQPRLTRRRAAKERERCQTTNHGISSQVAAKRKAAPEKTSSSGSASLPGQSQAYEQLPKRKRISRSFRGMPEEEIVKLKLDDYLAPNLRVIIVGINPGIWSAYRGHHYAGPGNHFWPCLNACGILPEEAGQVTYEQDGALLPYGIGFTNIVSRTSRSSADLSKSELRVAALELRRKLTDYEPTVVCFNGKGIYEVFAGIRNCTLGRQSFRLPNCRSRFFVMPSTSPRNAKLPRWTDKLPFFQDLVAWLHELEAPSASTKLDT